MPTKKQLQNLDYILILCTIALSIIGVTAIGSATKINLNGPEGEYQSQIIWVISGLVLLSATMLFDYRTISKLYIPLYIINILLLILVLFIGNGEGVNRWIFGIQPSEFAKIFMIIFLANLIDKYKEKVNNISTLCLILVPTGIVVLLIQAQPSLSASLVILSILVSMLFIAEIDKKYINAVLIILAVVIAIVLIDLNTETQPLLRLFLKDYQVERLLSSINFDVTSTDPSTYQTKNSVWAIGSGQLSGKGLYNGTVNQLNYLPESHNDFIFAVIGEEFGFIGCIIVLSLVLTMIIRILLIALHCPDNVGKLMAAGVAGMLAFQVFVNVGVVTGLLPNTGMPFPFLSYGGSSMWVNMMCIGLVLNIGIRSSKSLF